LRGRIDGEMEWLDKFMVAAEVADQKMGDLLKSFAISLLIIKVGRELFTLKKDGKPIKDEEFEQYVGDKGPELYFAPNKALRAIDGYVRDAHWTLQVQADMMSRIRSADAEGLWRIIRRLVTRDLIGVIFGSDPVDTAAHS